MFLSSDTRAPELENLTETSTLVMKEGEKEVESTYCTVVCNLMKIQGAQESKYFKKYFWKELMLKKAVISVDMNRYTLIAVLSVHTHTNTKAKYIRVSNAADRQSRIRRESSKNRLWMQNWRIGGLLSHCLSERERERTRKGKKNKIVNWDKKWDSYKEIEKERRQKGNLTQNISVCSS